MLMFLRANICGYWFQNGLFKNGILFSFVGRSDTQIAEVRTRRPSIVTSSSPRVDSTTSHEQGNVWKSYILLMNYYGISKTYPYFPLNIFHVVNLWDTHSKKWTLFIVQSFHINHEWNIITYISNQRKINALLVLIEIPPPLPPPPPPPLSNDV